MTRSCEVLAMMDTHTTTFGRKHGFTISRCRAFLYGVFFIIALIVTGVIVYHVTPRIDEKLNYRSCEDKQSSRESKFLQTFDDSTSGKKLDVRLPRSVIPDTYKLELMPFIWEGNFTFHGQVRILINITEDTNNVTLHATRMEIDEAYTKIEEYSPSNNSNELIKIIEQKNDTQREFHIMKTSQTLKRGKQYMVYLKFIGYLSDHLDGFYRSSYAVGNQTRWIATTQFQATHARLAFPCFDEPALKAKFEISIARPKNMTSLSNMPRKGDPQPVPQMPTYMLDNYEISLPMSTYLVAFMVFDFKMKNSDNFGVWAREEAIEQSLYSLDIGPRILKYFEDYFQIKYPLPKMDMVAIPDFSAGAMENWGLITYRETAMLYDENVSTSSNKQRVATVVSHELAHQWFGNLVTPSWWTDLWLNEGFANYVEYIGMDAVEPSWKVLEQFVINDLQNVFGLDALETSHPISNEVGHPDEISEIFDGITYAKGASIIRMMDHFLTTEVFKRGLTNYLNGKRYTSADQNDLWDALTTQAHKDGVLNSTMTIKEIMDTWTLQTGFPVVTVTRNYQAGTAVITQERFKLRNNTVLPTSSSQIEPLWWIPITYTSEKALDFNNTRPSHWMKAEKSINLEDLKIVSDNWVIFNIQETGYYRVNYDERNWRMIIKELNSPTFRRISTINRAQLIDDAFNLARAGRLDYSIALDVTTYLSHEMDYIPWKAALTAMKYLDNMLVKSEGYDKFRIHMSKLLNEVYKKVGFQDLGQDSQLTVYTRVDILNWACKLGRPDCVNNSLRQFHNWRNTPSPEKNNPISPNLTSVVYCTAIRYGGQLEWDFAWNRYLETNVGSEKDLLLNALGCTRETWILSRYLDWAITENSGIRKQDVTRVFSSVADNVIGQPLVFDYFRHNWTRLKEYLDVSLLHLNSIVKSTTKNLNTKYDLRDLLEFATDQRKDLGSGTRTVKQAIERTQENIKWLDKNHAVIRDWLKKNTA